MYFYVIKLCSLWYYLVLQEIYFYYWLIYAILCRFIYYRMWEQYFVMVKLVPLRLGTLLVLWRLSTEQYYIGKNLEEIKQSKTSSVFKQTCSQHKKRILKRKTQAWLLMLRFVSDEHNFPLQWEIIIPFIKVSQ